MAKTILDHAKEILYDRKEEKERQYGPFKESMAKAAAAASVLAGHVLSPNDIYAALIGVKLSRQGYANKYDNIVDCIVYLAQMSDELEELRPKNIVFTGEVPKGFRAIEQVGDTTYHQKDGELYEDFCFRVNEARRQFATKREPYESEPDYRKRMGFTPSVNDILTSEADAREIEKTIKLAKRYGTEGPLKRMTKQEPNATKKISTPVKNSIKKSNNNSGRKTRKAAKR